MAAATAGRAVVEIFKQLRKDLKMSRNLKALIQDENGGELLESALILGLIVVAAFIVIGAVGTKALAKWTSLSSLLD